MGVDQADLAALRIGSENRNGERPRKRGRLLRGFLFTAVALILVVLAGIALRQSFLVKPIHVQLASAELRSPSQGQALLSASGYVVAQRKAAVASKATGLLTQLNVKEGDQVKENQVIAQLQDNDIRALLSEAEAGVALSEADLKVAGSNLERQKNLAAISAAAQVDLEVAQTNYDRVVASIDMAKARLQAAQVALENTIIRAPFSGTILTKNADVGEFVAPMSAGLNARAAVVTIADMSSLQLEADVSESNIEKIHLGAACDIRLDAYPTQSYPGYVASIIPTADRAKGTVLCKVGFRNYDERVLPEMSAKVTFLKEGGADSAAVQPLTLTVPTTAVASRNGHNVVFKIQDGRAVELPVQTGKEFSGFVEILEGLGANDQVIDSVSDKIVNRARVSAD